MYISKNKMIISICGLHGAGKDTIGDYLVRVHGFKKMSFADALKDSVAAIFGWDREALNGLTQETRAWRESADEFWSNALGTIVTPRIILQTVGTHLFRDNFHRDIWMLTIKRRLLDLAKGQNVVITDCRFPNEMDMLREMGAQIVHVYRDATTPQWFYDYKYGSLTMDDLIEGGIHLSEFLWITESHHHDIENDGTIEILYSKVDTYLYNI